LRAHEPISSREKENRRAHGVAPPRRSARCVLDVVAAAPTVSIGVLGERLAARVGRHGRGRRRRPFRWGAAGNEWARMHGHRWENLRIARRWVPLLREDGLESDATRVLEDALSEVDSASAHPLIRSVVDLTDAAAR
jgi:hypothetical protein